MNMDGSRFSFERNMVCGHASALTSLRKGVGRSIQTER